MAKLEHVINGISSCFNEQIFSQMESKSGIFVGSAALTFLLNRANYKASQFLENDMAKIIGIVDDKGNIDIPELIKATKETVNVRGVLECNIPLVGKFALDEDFFELVKRYIEKEAAKQ